MTEVLLALGSNLGDRFQHLQLAIDELALAGITTTGVSSVWETAAVPADQPPFLNAVIAAETESSPENLLRQAKEIEWKLGRRPGRRWGPRPIDIDILFFGALAIRTEALTIPHERIRERGFVLAPLAEVTDAPLPLLDATAATLLQAAETAGLLRTDLRLMIPER